MKKAAGALLWRAFYLALGAFIYLGNAGWRMDARAWAFFALHAPVILWTSARMARAQGKLAHPSEESRWGRWCYAAEYMISYFVLYAAAGFFRADAPEIGWVFWLGIACALAAGALQIAAVEAIRACAIALPDGADRMLTSFDAGIYRAMRAPMTLGKLFLCAAAALIFGTIPVAIAVGAWAVAAVARQVLSEREAIKGDPEYAEYARRVRWRLIPFVW